MSSDGDTLSVDALVGKRVRLRGHFVGTVFVEDVEPLGGGLHHLRVRTEGGELNETDITETKLADNNVEVVDAAALVNGSDFFDVMEAHRIALAFAHDPNFAVSLS